MLLISPAGKYVDLPDEQTSYWIDEQGFTTATAVQEAAYRKQRFQLVDATTPQETTAEANAIYFSTLSARGKTDGYGMSGEHIINELRNLEVRVNDYYKGQKVGVLYHNPYSIMRLETPWRVLFTMFESDKLPDDWHDYLTFAHKILVPSKWCQSVFAKAGFDSTVVPLGYNDKIFHYMARPKREVYTFLHYDAFNLRKGFAEVLEAWQKAFAGNMDVRLILKTTRDFLPFPLIRSEYPNIEVVQGKFSEQELANLLFEADGFVFPSRGEGFGITPLEAMATGLPVAVPNAHGITEYFNDNYMYEVKVGEMAPAVYSRYKGQDVGKMPVVDTDDLAKVMKQMVKNATKDRTRSKDFSDYAASWTYAKTAGQLKVLFDDLLAQPAPKNKELDVLPLEAV